jgi:hypothetical protein
MKDRCWNDAPAIINKIKFSRIVIYGSKYYL